MNLLENPSIPALPPRFWWLRRIVLASSLFLLLLVALRAWWGWAAQQRLDAETARIIAAGEPIQPEDFNPKEDAPKDENAAVAYLETLENFSLGAEQTKAVDAVRSDAGAIRANADLVRGAFADNAEALRLVRRARDLTLVDWGRRFRSPVVPPANLWMAYMSERQLGKFLYVVAIHHAHEGDEAECVETLLDILALGRCLRKQPAYDAQIVSWAIDAGAIRGTERAVLALTGDARVATPEQRRDLLAAFLNESELTEGMRLGLLADRMSDLDLLRGVASGASSLQSLFAAAGPAPAPTMQLPFEIAYRPAVMLDMVTISTQTRRRLAMLQRGAFERPSPQAARSMLDAVLHPYSSVMRDSQDQRDRIYFRHVAWRRLAATGLAARMYRAEHGRFPATLHDLVPVYLPAVPSDALAPDGRTLAYLPDAAPPIVYSIGTDGVDDGGQFVDPDDYSFGHKLDLPFFLDGPLAAADEESDPPPRSSGQAEEHAGDTDQAQGQDDNDEEGAGEP